MKAILLTIILSFSLCSFSQQVEETAREKYNKYLDAVERADFSEGKQHILSILNGNYELSVYQQALVYQALGYLGIVVADYYQSRTAFERSIAILDSAGIISKQYIELIISRGNIDLGLGDFYSALTYYNRASLLLSGLTIAEEEKEILNAYIYLNTGKVYYYLKQYTIAIDNYSKALDIRMKHDTILQYRVYENLAECYNSLGQYDSTELYFHKTIQGITRNFDSSYYRLAQVYYNYSSFLFKNDSLDSAFKYILKSISLFESKFGESDKQTSISLGQLALYYLNINQYDSAVLYIDKALSCYNTEEDYTPSNKEDILFISNRNKCIDLNTKASIYLKWSLEEDENSIPKLLVAKSAIDQAISIVMKMHASYYNYQNRFNLLKSKKRYFLKGIEISQRLYTLTGEQQYLQDAYKFSSMAKGYEIKSQITKSQVLYEQMLPVSLRDSIEELGNSINICLHQMEMDPSEAGSEKNDSLLNLQLYNGFREYDKLMGKAADISPVFSKLLTENEVPDVVTIQKKLKGKEALVEYFIDTNLDEGKKKMYIFLVLKNDLRSVEYDLDSAFFADMEIVNELYSENNFNAFRSDSMRQGLNSSLYQLFSALLAPFENEIKGKDLFIIPDEDIHSLPFEILLTENVSGGKESYSTLPYLVKEHAISYAYASSLLFSQHTSRKGKLCVESIVPEYDLPESYGLNPLSEARKESEYIRKYFRCSSINDRHLSREEFYSLLEEDAVLNLAMHASRDDNNNEGASLLIPDKNDSVFHCYAYEIESLNLISPLVVLDACETASGVFNSGDGLYNLSRSFLLAGSPSVIHTLWKVEDKASAVLMDSFYKYLSRGYKKNRALQKAKLNYLKSMPPVFCNPVYWAGHHLTGDPSSLRRPGFRIILSVIIIALLILGYSFRSIRRRAFRAR